MTIKKELIFLNQSYPNSRRTGTGRKQNRKRIRTFEIHTSKYIKLPLKTLIRSHDHTYITKGKRIHKNNKIMNYITLQI